MTAALQPDSQSRRRTQTMRRLLFPEKTLRDLNPWNPLVPSGNGPRCRIRVSPALALRGLARFEAAGDRGKMSATLAE